MARGGRQPSSKPDAEPRDPLPPSQRSREHGLFSREERVFLVEQAGGEELEVVGWRGGSLAIVAAQKAPALPSGPISP